MRDFRVAWDNMCEAAKLPILLHDFRRSAIRNMIRAGVSEKIAMQFSGHVTRSVFDRYDIGSNADLADESGQDRKSQNWTQIGHRNQKCRIIRGKSLKTQCPSGGTGRRASFRS